jgi:phosphoribosylformimino-5-aminoimidazole carboxamide ribonucleotide (ProFAR) isomerase
VEGDFARATVFAEDPLGPAESFVAAGASWLHVVDLDAARDPGVGRSPAVGSLLAGVGERIEIELAGGIRTAGDGAAALELGAQRIVLGTAALARPALIGELVRVHGSDRVAVALDVRDGMAIGEGWRRGAPGRPVGEALVEMADRGAEWFEVTAIARDGRMAGPDLELLEQVVARRLGRIIASAGIRTVGDLERVRDLGCEAAIVGRALYDGGLDIAEALATER